MAEELVSALVNLREKEALEIVKEKLRTGNNPLKLLEDGRIAMEIVGKRFEEGYYFMPELIYSGEILREITEIVKPRITKADEIKRLGKFVIGTVAGDIHDLGKNIVTFMLDINGFEVYDLGVDVPPKQFINKIEETKAELVGLSGFMTLSFEPMKETVKAIEAAGLRDKVKIMIGGGQVDDKIRKYSGADAYRPDAMAAVLLAKEWVGGKSK